MEYLNKEALYELLDIEEAEDFQYFENLAALVECEDDIDDGALFQLMEAVDKETLSELIHNYFEEITDFLPGDSAEFYGILEKVKFALMGLSRNCDEEKVVLNLVDELERFRHWYTTDSKVYITSIVSGEEKAVPIRDAVTAARAESLTGEKYFYDFTDCMDYHLDEYVMSFADLVTAELVEEGDEEGDDLYN